MFGSKGIVVCLSELSCLPVLNFTVAASVYPCSPYDAERALLFFPRRSLHTLLPMRRPRHFTSRYSRVTILSVNSTFSSSSSSTFNTARISSHALYSWATLYRPKRSHFCWPHDLYLHKKVNVENLINVYQSRRKCVTMRKALNTLHWWKATVQVPCLRYS